MFGSPPRPTGGQLPPASRPLPLAAVGTMTLVGGPAPTGPVYPKCPLAPLPPVADRESGFTLIELLFATAILLVLTSAFYTITAFLHQDYQTQMAVAETQQEARVALSLFSNEAQKTGLDPTGAAFVPENQTNEKSGCAKKPQPFHPILEASETVFHLMGDVNGSGRFDKKNDEGEVVRYEWVGKEGIDSCGKRRAPFLLYRDTGGGAQEVASGIASFRLTYYDENGQKLPAGSLKESERDQIRKIGLTLQAVTQKEQERREFSSEIFLKNRG